MGKRTIINEPPWITGFDHAFGAIEALEKLFGPRLTAGMNSVKQLYVVFPGGKEFKIDDLGHGKHRWIIREDLSPDGTVFRILNLKPEEK